MRRTDGPFPIYELVPGQLYQRGKLHRLDPVKKWDGLRHYGITHVVALAPNQPDPHLIRRPTDPTYTHFPIPDGLLKTADHLQQMAVELAAEIEAGGRVLTLCNAGRNRSGLLSALIIRELSGLDGPTVMALIREHRPNALANPRFNEFLEKLP